MGNIRDFAIGIVDTAPSPATSGTSLVLQAGQGSDMPTVPFMAVAAPPGELPTKYNSELVEVTARSTDTLTITRAQGETSAQSIAIGWILLNPILTRDVDGYQAPVGAIAPFAGTTEPDGWLFCYGQEISRTVYADLFTAIGTTYGVGDGSATFNVPDLRGRVIAGQDDMGGSSANRLTGVSGSVNGDTLGGTGGAETHTLTEAELAVHDHPAAAGSYVYSVGAGGGAALTGGATMTTGANTGNAGSGSAHNNVQPTIILNYIIKATAPVTAPQADVDTAIQAMWPIGSVYENAAVSTNPATLFGFGTWTALGAGRVTVGFDSGQTEFDTLGETGGAKTHTLTTAEIPSHAHGGQYPTGSGAAPYGGMTNAVNAYSASLGGSNVPTASEGGGGAHNNLQPYIVVYRWQRTA